MVTSTELFVVFDAEGTMVWWNRGCREALGYREEEMADLRPGDLIHEEDRAGAWAANETLTEDGQVSRALSRFRRKDGTWRTFEYSVSRDPETGLVYGAGRDVSDRVAAEEALQLGRQLLQTILDRSGPGIFAKNLEGRYTLVNESFLSPVALNLEAVLGRTAGEVWPDFPDAIREREVRVMASGEAETSDEVVLLADGPHTFLTTRFPLRDPEGVVTGIGGIASDITGRVQAEAALEERERVLATIVGTSPDIIALLDRLGRVREVNEAAATVLGIPVGSSYEQMEALVHDEDRALVEAGFRQLLTGEVPEVELRYRVRHVDGHWVTLDSRSRASAPPRAGSRGSCG